MQGLSSRLQGVRASLRAHADGGALLRALKKKWSAADWQARLYFLAVVACVVIGITHRARGMFFARQQFWLDECSWGMYLMEQPLRELLIRPIGFMTISKGVALVFGASEVALRMLPWLAGVLAVLASPFLAQKLFTTRAARLVFVAALAFSIDAIDRAHEFKPYSCGLCVHLLVLLLAVRYLESRTRRDLLWTMGASIAAQLFAQDIMFVYPGLFLVLAATTLPDKRWKDLAWTAGGAAVAAGALILQYVLIWSRIPAEESNYWGKKYNVFFMGKDIVEHAKWQASMYWKVVALAGRRDQTWSWDSLPELDLASLVSADKMLWLGLHAVGVLVLLFRKRFFFAVLLLAPLFTTIAFNIADRWPWGPFRTNLYTLVYTAAIAASAFDALKNWKWGTDLVPALALLILPSLLLSNEATRWGSSPTHTLRMRQIIRGLVNAQGKRYSGPRETLLLDAYHCDPWMYYSKYHPRVRALYGDFSRRFEAICSTSDKGLEVQLKRARRVGSERIWVLRVKHETWSNRRAERFLENAYDVEEEGRVDGSLRSALRVKPEPEPEPG